MIFDNQEIGVIGKNEKVHSLRIKAIYRDLMAKCLNEQKLEIGIQIENL